jgi:hypothetical protein
VTRKAFKSEIPPEAQAGVTLEAGQNDPVERRLLATPSNGPAPSLALIERVALDPRANAEKLERIIAMYERLEAKEG